MYVGFVYVEHTNQNHNETFCFFFLSTHRDRIVSHTITASNTNNSILNVCLQYYLNVNHI